MGTADPLLLRQGSRCDHCGQPLTANRWPDPDMIRMPRRQRQILRALIAANGHFVSVSRLADILYGDDEDGGPLGAENSVNTHVHKLRRRLEPIGLFIDTARFEGYRLDRHEHMVLNVSNEGKGELAWPAR